MRGGQHSCKCHQIGVPVRVFESVRQLRPLGVGINLQPNAVRELHDLGLAKELAAMPPIAVAGVMRCVVGAGEKTLEEGITEERRAVMRTMGTEDQKEGMRAFLEKRKPRFTGR